MAKFGHIGVASVGVPGPVQGEVMGPSLPLRTKSPISFNMCFPGVGTLLVRNDLHMAAHAELRHGVGETAQNFVLVSLSTGIGVAVVVGGRLLEIRTEMGHQLLVTSGGDSPRCLNHAGCWASLCSGAAIAGSGSRADYAELRAINRVAFANLVAAYDPEIIVVMGGVAENLFDEVVPRPDELRCMVIRDPVPGVQLTCLGRDIGVRGALALALALGLS